MQDYIWAQEIKPEGCGQVKMKEPVKKTSLGSFQQRPREDIAMAVPVIGRPPVPKNRTALAIPLSTVKEAIVQNSCLTQNFSGCGTSIRKGKQMKRPSLRLTGLSEGKPSGRPMAPCACAPSARQDSKGMQLITFMSPFRSHLH